MPPFREADNARVSRAGNQDRGGPMGGWDQMRARMIGEDDAPTIYCFSTCVDSIRTIPVLQHDPNRAEDLDTHTEDHAADDWRYACMSRPWRKTPPEKTEPKDGYQLRLMKCRMTVSSCSRGDCHEMLELWDCQHICRLL